MENLSLSAMINREQKHEGSLEARWHTGTKKNEAAGFICENTELLKEPVSTAGVLFGAFSAHQRSRLSLGNAGFKILI